MKRNLTRVLVALMALTMIFGASACNKPEDNKIGVVRNGGPWDNHKVREASGEKGVICPGSGAAWNGWGSDLHSYPSSDSQRTFKFSHADDADTGPITELRTKDGVKVTLSGTVFFRTAFDCTAEGQRKLREFDEANYARPSGQKPWEDFPGWLANQWKPILDSTARDVLLGIECKDVISSCALLARDEGAAEHAVRNSDNKSSVQRIEAALRDGLVAKLKEKLGDDYFAQITFNMEPVALPEVDEAIATAQRAFAKVADVRAERLKQQEQVKVERQKREVNRQKQKGYALCPSCARQDEYRALPHDLQVLGGNPATVLR